MGRTAFGKRGLPSPKKILKRGIYEMMWGASTRDYGKRVKDDNGRKSK
jgi:hypothetical protein